MNKKAFTIIEMLVVIIIIWVWLIWVFTITNNSYKFLFDIKSKLVAINIARSGVEWVFNIRNTNWQRWWWKKDKCWLKINSLIDDSNDGCENDTWFWSWSYKLYLTWTSQKYFELLPQSSGLKLDWDIVPDDWKYLLCKENWTISPCSTSFNSRPNDYFAQALYFQQVRWWYLLDKNWDKIITCNKWDDSECWDWRFLEKNFCVDVIYLEKSKKSITLCSVMTNFEK